MLCGKYGAVILLNLCVAGINHLAIYRKHQSLRSLCLCGNKFFAC